MYRMPQEYFQKWVTEEKVPCLSILAVRKDEVLCDFCEGRVISGANERPIDKRTRFNVGSVTKPVTGSLIVKLMELGEVSLNDTVKRFIPEYPFDHVTVYHLLTHSAGYGPVSDIAWPREPHEKQSYLEKIYAVDTLKYAPGAASEYFSFGYSILMDIIERITGDTLNNFAKKVLFDPMDMKDTTYEIGSLKRDEYVLPYSRGENRFLDELSKSPATGDSGLYTHAGDLIKFCQMILHKGVYGSHRVFAESSIDFMLREITNHKFMKTPIFWIKGPADSLGCFGDMCSEFAVGHTGFSGCMMFIDPVYETAAVILSNSTDLHGDWNNYKKICNRIMSLV